MGGNFWLMDLEWVEIARKTSPNFSTTHFATNVARTAAMGGGRGKKRNYTQYAHDDRPNDVGIGATLAHLRNPEPIEMTRDAERSDAGDWEVVTKGNKKHKKNNYPSLSYSDLHRLQSSVKLGDLQGLVLYCLADGTSPQWVSVRHHNMVKKAVVLFIPGLEKGMFNGNVLTSETQEKLVEREDELPQANGGSDMPYGQCHEGTSNSRADSTSKQPLIGHRPVHTMNAGTFPDDYLPTKLDSTWLPESLKPLAAIFDNLWPIKAPGDDRWGKVHSALQAMLQSPITKTQEGKRFEKDFKGPNPAMGGKHLENKRTPISTYIMSTEDLQDNEYILHPVNFTETERENELQRRVRDKQASADGWIDTKVLRLEDGATPDRNIEQGSLLQGRRMLAMDCEMCQVEGDELALTRISLVDWDGSTVMDEFVKPDLPITNYLTPYSGITAEKLESVSTSLGQIQERLIALLTPTTILVGHSLNADLAALKLTHPFIIDTALLYPHPRGPPLKSSLKWLAQKYLSREIQRGHGSSGHDSIEDAIACLDLVKLKGEKGPTWGTSEASNESIFKRLKRASAPGANRGGEEGRGRIGAIIDHGHPERNFGQMASYCIGCNSDSDIVAGVKRAVLGDIDGAYIPGGGVDFIWARLRELEALRGWRNDNPMASSPHSDPEPSALAAAVAQTITHIKDVRNFLPPCTLLIVYSGTGDPREMARLQEMQRRYKKEFQTKKWDDLSIKWTDVEEQMLKAAVKKAREGLGFVAIT